MGERHSSRLHAYIQGGCDGVVANERKPMDLRAPRHAARMEDASRMAAEAIKSLNKLSRINSGPLSYGSPAAASQTEMLGQIGPGD